MIDDIFIKIKEYILNKDKEFQILSKRVDDLEKNVNEINDVVFPPTLSVTPTSTPSTTTTPTLSPTPTISTTPTSTISVTPSPTPIITQPTSSFKISATVNHFNVY